MILIFNEVTNLASIKNKKIYENKERKLGSWSNYKVISFKNSCEEWEVGVNHFPDFFIILTIGS